MATDSIEDTYASYLTDESRKSGVVPERMYFPESTEEVASVLAEVHERGEAITISGARTGIAGGAVAAAKNLLVLDGLKKAVSLRQSPDGNWFASTGAGTTLSDLKDALRSTEPDGLFYPVDPTETSASVGGTIATNASGARTLKYGPTRDWVNRITAVLADGSILTIERGNGAMDGEALDILQSDGSQLVVPLCPVAQPPTKHTAGYCVTPEMDPIDLFIGGEGTLCIVTEAELRLATLPGARLCLVLFLTEDEPAGIVADLLPLGPAAVEYMDSQSLDLLRESKSRNEDAGAVPEMPKEARAALYVEFEGEDDAGIEEIFGRLEGLLDRHGVAEEQTWAGFDQADMDAMKAFRHALPERINTIIGERKRGLPDLTKVGTDMAVPFDALGEMLGTYKEHLKKTSLEYCVFGHIGNAHLHVNILPRSMEEVETAYSLYRQFAELAVKLGGSVAGEHGIGRLKKRFMDIQYSAEELLAMARIKRSLDPDEVLNPGVMYDFDAP
jgi:D-lactate dehydrogenase (cytochrome)